MSQVKTIALAADHAGFAYKTCLKAFLEAQGYTCLDFGTHSTDSMDYPDVIHPLAQALEAGQAPLGIIICGSGNGVAITANKYAHIRAALCWLPELAALSRQHNDANVLSIPARFVSEETAEAMVEQFIHTPFEGGRHAQRVAKICPC